MRVCPKLRWIKEEIGILKQVYPNGEKSEILKQLPNRSSRSIETKARRLGLKRGSLRSKNPMWKGDEATKDSARQRIIRAIPVPKGFERHHIDGNPFNNDRTNIQITTRKQHMVVDGRLNRLISRNKSVEMRQKASERMRAQWGGN